jgi:hypothetical protein
MAPLLLVGKNQSTPWFLRMCHNTEVMTALTLDRGGYGHEAENGALLVSESMTWESEMEENVDSVQDLILMCAPQRQSQKICFKIFADRFDLGPDQLSCVERIGLSSRPLELEYGELVFEFAVSS